MTLNPENKCAQLWGKETPELKDGEQTLSKIFEMQKSLQLRLGQDFSTMSLEQRTQLIKDNYTYMITEMTELIENLPFKHWKKYTAEQKQDFTSEEHKLETWYEWCDVMHFFVNVGLLLGIDGDAAWKLYASKNAENFARQDRGY
jgi:dimeric dUTPase (all-alpha-NTP-PPase superfamily)